MNIQSPKVSIGLPVYNGENFIKEAIDSILNQTFEDFELIISDNASSDRTEAICQAYVTQDRRVRYFRNSENLGAADNFNRVFRAATGEYFKWAAHDDVCAPTFIAECVKVLDREPTIILCHARTITINAQGKPFKQLKSNAEINSTIPYKRFREFISEEIFQSSNPISGLIRADVLNKTPLLGNYPAHDLPLLAELSLHGRFYQIPEYLFYSRDHSQRGSRAFDYRQPHKAIVWFDPKMAGKLIFPSWRMFAEYMAGINRAPLSWRDRLLCYSELAKWAKNHQQNLGRDLIVATEYLPVIGAKLAKAYRKGSEARWLKQVKQSVKQLETIISKEETFILVDEDRLGKETFAQWKTIPFLEHEGKYWGLPADDSTAIQELERLRQLRANFIVFAWSSFWWFDHYCQFYDYLRSKFDCILENNYFVVFNLQRELEFTVPNELERVEVG
ncbi:MAG: glycosyltransferase [Nostoc sp.]|uniref:glycosyltransferase family 2 protein n=1 Tax=Nostoc sp. TaxID=1180 RepID=UPI002FF5D78D